MFLFRAHRYPNFMTLKYILKITLQKYDIQLPQDSLRDVRLSMLSSPPYVLSGLLHPQMILQLITPIVDANARRCPDKIA